MKQGDINQNSNSVSVVLCLSTARRQKYNGIPKLGNIPTLIGTCICMQNYARKMGRFDVEKHNVFISENVLIISNAVSRRVSFCSLLEMVRCRNYRVSWSESFSDFVPFEPIVLIVRVFSPSGGAQDYEGLSHSCPEEGN